MASRDTLFRDSVWTRRTSSLALHRLSELSTAHNSTSQEETDGEEEEYRHKIDPTMVSRFSLDTGDLSSVRSSRPMLSPLSQISHLTPKRTWHSEPLTPVPRVYSIGQRPRRHVIRRVYSQKALSEKPWEQVDVKTAQEVQHTPNTPAAPRMSRAREVLFVSAICASHLCIHAGIGQSIPIIPAIGTTFGIATTSHLSWVVSSYTLAIGSFTLVAERTASVFGHKPVFILGLVVFSVWSAAAGASYYATQALFVICHAFQGLGAAFMLPTGFAILSSSCEGEKRRRVLALYAAMAPLGLILGAFVSSALTLGWWSLTFWVTSLILAITVVISGFVIPADPRTRTLPSGARAIIAEFDIPGILVGVSSLVLFGLAWNEAHVVGWQQQSLWIALIAACLLAGVFVVIESYYAARPIVPLSKLRPEVFWILSVLACAWAAFGVWVFYTWQFALSFRAASALLSTAYFVPFAMTGCLAIAGMAFLRRMNLRVVLCAALLLVMIGSVLVASMPPVQTYWAQIFVSTLAMGCGVYATIPSAAQLLHEIAHRRHRSVTEGLVTTVAYYSISLGLGVAGTVERQVSHDDLDLRNVFEGYRGAFWLGVGVSGLGFGISFLLALLHRSRRSRCCSRCLEPIHGPC
ncbi:major facilitator superfamily domain-containing protein [Xylariaceae sp. FL1272]|nr:major facilitator superfamily domain-containing protein [Xylariaceae sp. FL1272]